MAGKIPGFGTGDEAKKVWVSSACTNMSLFSLFTHDRYPLKWFHAGIIA